MTALKSALNYTGLKTGILLIAVFVGLNILDAWLTGVALGLGSSELNPILGVRFGSSMLIKGLLSSLIVMALVLFKRPGLLKPLSVGMLLVCAWNSLAIWSWS
jgi:hypothetical protein